MKLFKVTYPAQWESRNYVVLADSSGNAIKLAEEFDLAVFESIWENRIKELKEYKLGKKETREILKHFQNQKIVQARLNKAALKVPEVEEIPFDLSKPGVIFNIDQSWD